jgi:hypothetical protein
MADKKKITKIVLGALTGISGATAMSALLAYDAIFKRYNRPDYNVTPGMYNIDRFNGALVREEFDVYSNDVKLKGYFYPAKKPKGLVVIAHGLHAGGDDYLPMVKYLVDHNYNVFNYNVQGTYESEGDDCVGMCQSLIDLESVLTFLQNTPPFSYMPICLIGHSWGGYAVSSVLELKPYVKACACIAPMNSGADMMVEKGEQYVGKIASFPEPIFKLYHKHLFNKYPIHNGVRGINSCKIPVIIAQGVTDKIITYDGQSITAHKDELRKDNVIFYDGFGPQGDHNNIWHSVESAVYQDVVKSKLKLLEIEKGAKLTYEEKVAFYKTVDHELYSQVNEELFKIILDTFDKAITTN